MTGMQLTLLSTALLVLFVYYGGTRFSVRVVRNIAGGLGVVAGLSLHSALGLADSGFAYKVGFVIAGYAMALGVLRFRGVES